MLTGSVTAAAAVPRKRSDLAAEGAFPPRHVGAVRQLLCADLVGAGLNALIVDRLHVQFGPLCLVLGNLGLKASISKPPPSVVNCPND